MRSGRFEYKHFVAIAFMAAAKVATVYVPIVYGLAVDAMVPAEPAGIAAVSIFSLEAKGVDVVGVLPKGFPSPSIPDVHRSDLSVLAAGAIGTAWPGTRQTPAGRDANRWSAATRSGPGAASGRPATAPGPPAHERMRGGLDGAAYVPPDEARCSKLRLTCI